MRNVSKFWNSKIFKKLDIKRNHEEILYYKVLKFIVNKLILILIFYSKLTNTIDIKFYQSLFIKLTNCQQNIWLTFTFYDQHYKILCNTNVCFTSIWLTTSKNILHSVERCSRGWLSREERVPAIAMSSLSVCTHGLRGEVNDRHVSTWNERLL